MSDVFRFGLNGDFRDRLRRCLPGVTDADLQAFEALLARDCIVTDDGAPHVELVAWVQHILDRRGGAEPVPALVPVNTLPAPAGALIGGAA
jgi:hypothetical protein